MGKRGPIAKSNAQRRLEGNPSRRPMKEDSLQPAPGIPYCPDWLSPEAKEEWARVAPELGRLGLLTQLDMALLAGYCTSCALWRYAQEVLNTQGTTYVTVRGRLEVRPEVAIAKMAAEQMSSLAAEFGLTPASRARLGITTTHKDIDTEDIDPLEALLNDRNNGGN